MKMYPIKLEPVYVKTIWQADNLAKIRHLKTPVGTAWDISAHKNANTKIANGKFKGKSLLWLIDHYPKETLGAVSKDKILRVAILDAKENLSIQVHPNDEYAKEHENDLGKVEAWYILAAKKEATLVAGTKAKNKAAIEAAIKKDDVKSILNEVKVKKGDFICIDTGELHALGAGMMAVEFGQNGDTTYRFYDYHRKDKNNNERQLHLKQSLDIVDCKKSSKLLHTINKDIKTSKCNNLLKREEFSVDLIDIVNEYRISNNKSFYNITNVEKATIVEYENTKYTLAYLESIFIPAACKDVKIIGNTRVLISYASH